MKNILTDEEFIKICNESISMASACATIGLQFSTFKRRAIKLGCYNTNQSGKGINKKFAHRFELDDIINGQHPQYQSNKLRKRLRVDKKKDDQNKHIYICFVLYIITKHHLVHVSLFHM